jgi:hypothetical protein
MNAGPATRRSPIAQRLSKLALRLSKLALRLYPLAYQRRYGEEMLALLEDQPPRARTVLDLLKGAARAHLRPGDAAGDAVGPADRVRASASGVLACWVFFAAAGFGYYKTTEDEPFSLAGHAHPLLRDVHLAVQALAVIASAAVVVGALPLIVSAVARARREPGLRRTMALALLPVIVFGALTAVVLAIAHTQAPNHSFAAGYGMAVVWGIAALVCGATCVLGCRAALFATPARPAQLRVALAAGTIVTVAMVAIACGTAVYAIALTQDAAHLAGAPDGPFNLLSTSASLILQVVVMVVAAGLAAIATRRGWRAEGKLSAT